MLPICGSNNVGKTYVAYAIYGFIKHFQNFVKLSVSSEQINLLKKEGTLTINLRTYQDKLLEFFKNASEEFTDKIADYFNTSAEFFNNSKIEFSNDNCSLDFSHEFKRQGRFGEGETLIFDKASDSEELSIALIFTGEIKIPNRLLETVISDAISSCLFSRILPEPFVITSERTGIALFYKELDLSKNAMLEHLTEMGRDEIDPLSLLRSMRSRYARPIKDNIDIIRDAETISKTKSFIREDKKTYQYVLDALQTLLGGSFKITDTQVIYQPKKEIGFPIPKNWLVKNEFLA